MYIFVRFTAIVTILFGVLLMLSGAIGAVYGFFQNDAVTLAINSALETANDMRRVINAGYAGVVLGTVAFVVGMFTAALGQLLLVFVDLAVQTRETNVILRGFRPRAAARPLNGEVEKYDQKEEVYG
jgi:hypothetical protein